MKYTTIYSDAYGSISTEIIADGTTLVMNLNGLNFKGQSFDDFSPSNKLENNIESIDSRFQLWNGCLCACKIHSLIPIELFWHNQIYSVFLQIRVLLGTGISNGGLDHESLIIKLTIPPINQTIITRFHESFEDALKDLQNQFDIINNGANCSVFLRCCFNCNYSDYSPLGNGLFGDLYCFRNTKDEYLSIKDKMQLFDLWDSNAGSIQETWLCPIFKFRKKAVGYRGK